MLEITLLSIGGILNVLSILVLINEIIHMRMFASFTAVDYVMPALIIIALMLNIGIIGFRVYQLEVGETFEKASCSASIS